MEIVKDGKKKVTDDDEKKETKKEIKIITIQPVDGGSTREHIHINPKKNYVYFYWTQTVDDVTIHVTLPASVKASYVKSDINEKSEFLSALGIYQSGLNKLTESGYKLLNLITFFTAGKKESRAWTVEKGTKANKAAGKIHNDFFKGFIAAETISYQDYISCNGEQKARDLGKMRVEGKDYKVNDGDVMLFRFNV